MGKNILLLIICVAFACGEDHQWSDHKSEVGIVVAKQFRGEIDASGSSLDLNLDTGDLSVGVVTLHESEKFDVVFRCEHGILFTINDPDLYLKVQENDSVEIIYREYTGVESGKILDLDFIDANTIQNGRSGNN